MTMGKDSVQQRMRVSQPAPNWLTKDKPLGWYEGRYYRVNFGAGGAGYRRWQEFMKALTLGAHWLAREQRDLPRAEYLRGLRHTYSTYCNRELNGLAWYADIAAEDYALVTHAVRGAGYHTGRKDKWYLMLRTYGKPSARNRRPNAGWWHPDPEQDGL